MKKFLTFILVLAMVLSVSGVAMANAKVSTPDAFKAAMAAGGNVTLDGSFELSESVSVPEGITVVLDLAGKTITGKDAATGNFGLIDVKGTLTVKDSVGGGAITLNANNNRGWSNYSAVIANLQGSVTIEGGTIEHLGGTDMAYGIDNNTNGNLGDAILVVNNGTIKSTYRAIRQFANSETCQNKATINNGTIYGAKGGVWVHDSSSKQNIATLEIKDGDISGDTQAIQLWDAHSGATSDAPTSIENIDIKISGGNIEGPVLIFFSEESANDGTTLAAKGAEFKVSGGTFTDSIVNNLLASDVLAATVSDGTDTVYAIGAENIEEAAEKAAKKSGAENVTVTVTQGDAAFDEDDLPGGATVKNDGNGNVTVGGNTPDPSHGLVVPTPAPQVTNKPTSSGSGISVTYNGGNSFSTSNPAVPTAVEIDGVPVAFNGNGKSFTVSCINPGAKWVTVRWNSTTVTTNFTPDAQSYCAQTVIPKTGDVSVVAYALMAVVAAAGAMLKK